MSSDNSSHNSPVKIIVRTLLKYKGQTFILFFLTLLPGLIFTYLDIPVTSFDNAYNQVRAGSQPEQFRFMVSVPSSENDSITPATLSGIDIEQLNDANNQLRSKYGFASELVRKKFLQQDFNDKKCNFYIKLMPKSINMPVFLSGSAPARNGQAAVSKLFAEKNGLLIGSLIKIDSKDYVVSGIYVAPDEVVAFDQTKSPDMSPDTNARILMLEDDFEGVNRDESAYFVGRFTTEDDDVIRNQVSTFGKEYNILYANMSSEYMEISELSASVNINTQLMFFAMFTMCVMVAVSILIQVPNQFASYRKSIGIMMAMGCSRARVVFAYSIYFFVFAAAALLGMVLGFFMSYSFIEGASDSYNVAFAEPSVDGLKWLLFMSAAALPLTLFVMALAYRETRKMPLTLMGDSNKKQRVNVLVKGIKNLTSFMKLKNRVKVSVAAHKAGRLLSILLTFFIAYNLLGAGLAINSSANRTLSEYKEFLKFDRIEHYDSTMTGNMASEHNSNADVFIDEDVKLVKNMTKNMDVGASMILQGIPPSQQSIGINSSLLADGVIISQIAASKYNLAVNDDLQFLADGNYYRYKVAGINEAAFDSKIYIDISEMYYWDKYAAGDYTGAYITSESKGQDVYNSIRSEDLISFYGFYGQGMGTISGVLLLMSFLIGLPLIILMAIFNYNDTIVHVALSKSLGHKNRTVNSMFVNVFDPVGVIGCLLGMLSLPFLLKWFENVMIAQSLFSSDYYLFFQVSLSDMVIAFAALMFCYGICKSAINLVTTRGRSIASVLRSDS